jgi:phytoene dehydrogenase-like protein
VNVSVWAVAVHRHLAQLVPLRDGSKVLRRSPVAELVPVLRILNQPIDCPLNVLVLGQVDPFHLCGLHLLLQHMRVVYGNRYAAGMFEGILDHLLCSIVEHGVDFSLANSVSQTKMFMHAKEN